MYKVITSSKTQSSADTPETSALCFVAWQGIFDTAVTPVQAQFETWLHKWTAATKGVKLLRFLFPPHSLPELANGSLLVWICCLILESFAIHCDFEQPAKPWATKIGDEISMVFSDFHDT